MVPVKTHRMLVPDMVRIVRAGGTSTSTGKQCRHRRHGTVRYLLYCSDYTRVSQPCRSPVEYRPVAALSQPCIAALSSIAALKSTGPPRPRRTQCCQPLSRAPGGLRLLPCPHAWTTGWEARDPGWSLPSPPGGCPALLHDLPHPWAVSLRSAYTELADQIHIEPWMCPLLNAMAPLTSRFTTDAGDPCSLTDVPLRTEQQSPLPPLADLCPPEGGTRKAFPKLSFRLRAKSLMAIQPDLSKLQRLQMLSSSGKGSVAFLASDSSRLHDASSVLQAATIRRAIRSPCLVGSCPTPQDVPFLPPDRQRHRRPPPHVPLRPEPSLPHCSRCPSSGYPALL